MRRTLVVTLAAVLLPAVAFATINKRSKPDPNTVDGKALNGIIWEADEARRIEYLEYFEKQYPHSEWRASAYALLQDLYVRRGQPEKALEAGDKILALDPDDLETARRNQQIAASKGDTDRARKYADMGYASALRLTRLTGVPGEDASDAHDRIELAKGLIAEYEYQLFDRAARTTEPRQKIELLDQLVKANPATQYLDNAGVAYFGAYRQLNENGKALEIAERMTSSGQFYPDMLLFEGDYYFRTQKNPAKAARDCGRLIGEIESDRAPADFDDTSWSGKKNVFLGQARLIEFYSYKQLNDAAGAVRAADSILLQPGAPPDVMLYAADYYFRVDRNVKRVQDYSEQLLRTIGDGRKPAGLADTEWMRQKDVYTEVASYMIGSLQMEKGNYTAAGETLRQSWEIAKRTGYMFPAITGVLAATDQHLEKYTEAAKLYKQSMEFGPAYRVEALKKLAALKNEHGIE